MKHLAVYEGKEGPECFVFEPGDGDDPLALAGSFARKSGLQLMGVYPLDPLLFGEPGKDLDYARIKEARFRKFSPIAGRL